MRTVVDRNIVMWHMTVSLLGNCEFLECLYVTLLSNCEFLWHLYTALLDNFVFLAYLYLRLFSRFHGNGRTDRQTDRQTDNSTELQGLNWILFNFLHFVSIRMHSAAADVHRQYWVTVGVVQTGAAVLSDYGLCANGCSGTYRHVEIVHQYFPYLFSDFGAVWYKRFASKSIAHLWVSWK
jgi:hypothetical protein